MSRPEHTAPPEIFYGEREAKKYNVSSRMNQIQKVITERALELLNLPPGAGPQLILDIGCGTGLSGEAIESAGHAWIGIDISEHMLNHAANRFEREAKYADEANANKKESEDADEEMDFKSNKRTKFENDKSKMRDDDDEEEEDDEDDEDDDEEEDEDDDDDDEEEEANGAPIGDVICRDMGSGVGFRGGIFDGAISISAIQWLCYANHRHHVPKLRLRTFFQSLYSSLKRGARAVLQFYPETPQQMELITDEAIGVGFTGGVVVDYPNSAKAKKYYLVLFAGRPSSSSSSSKHKRANSSGASVAASAMTVATAVSRYTMPPLPKGLDGDAPDEFNDSGDEGDNGGRSRKGIPFESRTREKKRGKKRVRDRKDRPATKSREWIKQKRQRQLKQGKTIKNESKYTGRRRKGGF